MRSISRFGTALMLGAMISACGGNKDAANTSAQTGGEPAAASGTSAGATGGAMDSAAPAGAAGASGAAGALASMSAGDQVAVISASNAAEIATSKAAQPKLTNGDAKSFARDMISEHTTMQAMGDQAAKKANITGGAPDLATEKTKMANDMATQLGSAAKGAALDKQYIDGQVQAHQQTLEQLQALQNASDSTVKSLATQALPKVQAHLERAQKIQQSLGGAAGTDSAAAKP